MSASETLRRTPLFEEHKRAGGKLVPFADPDKPWLCWESGEKVPFTPTPTDFS